MNVKGFNAIRRALTAVAFYGLGLLVAGWSAIACAALSIDDPLETVPDVLHQGVTLPGDEAALGCPVKKDFSLPLTLDEAVDLALCNNPQIQEAWAGIKIQAGALGEARAAYLPTVSATVNRLDDRTSYPNSRFVSTDITSTTVYGAISWRLFDFGGRAANLQAAQNLLASALASHDAALQKTLTAVIQAYFDAYTADSAVDNKRQDEAIAQHTLDAARMRETKGVGAQSDTLQAATALAKATLDKNRTQGAYQKALATLVYALGVPPETPVLLPDTLEEPTASASQSLKEWLDAAQQTHPALISARAALDAATNKVTVTRSAGLPTVDFNGNYYQNGRPGQTVSSTTTHESTVGVSLTIPVFDGFSTTYKVRGAEAQVEEKVAELADTQHQILMAVVQAYADAQSALNNLQSSADLLSATQASLAVSQRKYDKGASDILELLSTQNALADAQQERIRCLDDWRSACLRLLASAGQMGRSAVTK